jgi:hypothetical protein
MDKRSKTLMMILSGANKMMPSEKKTSKEVKNKNSKTGKKKKKVWSSQNKGC